MNDSECEIPYYEQEKFKELDLKFFCGNASNKVYDDVLQIRSKVYNTTIDQAIAPGDEYSDHYCLYIKDLPISCIRVTSMTKGVIDCEHFYPKNLINLHKNKIISSTRYCSLPSRKINLSLFLLKTAWLDQLKKGARIDLINVREEMIRYYQKIGYSIISGSSFIHPYWGTQSVVMILIVDKLHKNSFNKIFDLIDDDATVSEKIIKELNFCDFSNKLLPSKYICSCFSNSSHKIKCSLIPRNALC